MRFVHCLLVSGALCCLADGEPAPPSLEEILRREIHGAFKLAGKRLEVRYEFRDGTQGEDFLWENELRTSRNGVSLQHAAPKCTPGALRLVESAPLLCNLPFQKITSATFRATGVSDFSVLLAGQDARIEVHFGKEPTIITGEDWFGFGKERSQLNIDPKKVQEFEVVIDKGKIIGKLNGVKVQERDLPRALRGAKKGRGLVYDSAELEEIGFYTQSKESPSLTWVHLRGEVAADAQDAATNRGRGGKGLAPIFTESFCSEGTRYRVLSPISQSDADGWRTSLERLCESFLADHQPDGTVIVKPPEEITHVYRFASVRTFDAFLEEVDAGDSAEATSKRGTGKRQRTAVGKTEIAKLRDGNFACYGWSVTDLLRRVVEDLQQAMLPELPWWLLVGNTEYYIDSLTSDGDDSRITALRRWLAKRYSEDVLEYLESGEQPDLSDILAGWKPQSEDHDLQHRVACAWVRFLRKGEDGKLHSQLGGYYGALRDGASPAEATEKNFPEDGMPDLIERFRKFLRRAMAENFKSLSQ